MQQLFYSTVLGIWKMIALTLYRTITILNNWWGLWSSQLPTMLQIPMTEPYPWNYTPNTPEDIKKSQSINAIQSFEMLSYTGDRCKAHKM